MRNRGGLRLNLRVQVRDLLILLGDLRILLSDSLPKQTDLHLRFCDLLAQLVATQRLSRSCA